MYQSAQYKELEIEEEVDVVSPAEDGNRGQRNWDSVCWSRQEHKTDGHITELPCGTMGNS